MQITFNEKQKNSVEIEILDDELEECTDNELQISDELFEVLKYYITYEDVEVCKSDIIKSMLNQDKNNDKSNS